MLDNVRKACSLAIRALSFPDMVKALGNNRKHMGIKQGIVNSFAIPAVLDQAVLFENAELVGNGALGHTELLSNIVDAFFFINQCV